jgi:hypothetical protein
MEGTKFKIDESSPEVKSFIYQQIQVFEFFMTPKSIINVVSRRVTANGDLSQKPEEDTVYKVVISIADNSTSLEEEAISSNIFEAIVLAKTKLYNTLLKIQDEVISLEDREAEITHAKNSAVH